MKNVSEGLAAHLLRDVTRLAYVVRIVRQDGVVLGLTSHDVDVVIEGTLYHADGAFSVLRSWDWRDDLKAKTFDVAGIMDSDLLKKEDIEAGFYDRALVDIGVCHWDGLEDGILPLRRGWIGDVVLVGSRYVASFHGMQDLLKRRIGDVYTPECRHCLGDAMCRVDRSAWTVEGVVEAVWDEGSFIDTRRVEAAGTFAFGELLWVTGAQAGRRVDVIGHDPVVGRVMVSLDASLVVAVGDAYRLVAGCDKRFASCREKFLNGKNFGGFPHLAGLGKILAYPESS